MSCTRPILARRAIEGAHAEGQGPAVRLALASASVPRLRVGLASTDIAALLCATRVLTARGIRQQSAIRE